MDIQTMMASTVHDVKNSLGLIDSQLLHLVDRASELDIQVAEDIQRIQLECARINNGMVHMLGLYRMEQGQLVAGFEDVMVNDVVEDSISRHGDLLKARGIDVKIRDNTPEGLWYIDPNLVEGLLTNLITNSIRYTKASIKFLIQEQDGWLNIRMTDDGEGFPKAMLGTPHEPEALNYRTGATGLGLYFCQQIAQLHVNKDRKGYIELSNLAEKEGAVIDLWLP
ncbi:sensor histidine kinase [Reinekea thalattae]|uniref:histidine kinase n=1 Tax=Reinekea thalattae TaxID=2593301 RepID=A0A5C8Z773_9GAMM|nr:HAMP domain-containing sensor histidine kinase [Reinekea thalattae]TXR53802.1 HAMP domain-containing histidine kinase [Reinekea thalattae]